MIVRKEIKCPSCESEFNIEFNIEANPMGVEVCPFCQEYILSDEELTEVDLLMED